jgi:hypothetical protein
MKNYNYTFLLSISLVAALGGSWPTLMAAARYLLLRRFYSVFRRWVQA